MVYRFPSFWKAQNIIMNGGVVSPSLVELWGPPQSGKTLYSYDFMSRNKNPNYKTSDLIMAIIDNELSTDELRLKKVFNLTKATYVKLNENTALLDSGIIQKYEGKALTAFKELPNTDGDYIICPYTYLEMSFDKMSEICKAVDKKKQVFFLFDSISTQVTKASVNAQDGESMWAGGRQEAPRVLKFFTAKLLTSMYGKNVICFLINHVMAGDYGEVAPGGFSFHHNLHLSIFFRKNKEQTDLGGSVVVNTLSDVKITKNKFGPRIYKGTLVVSVKDGGKILEAESDCTDFLTYGVIKHRGSGWYVVQPVYGDTGKRFDDIVQDYKTNPEIHATMLKMLEDLLYTIYPGVKAMSEMTKEETTNGAGSKSTASTEGA